MVLPPTNLDIRTPRWAIPLLQPSRYKGAHGGRSGGKSHFFAERIVEMMVCDLTLSVICIREIQKSITLSVKKLIDDKIRSMGVSHLFDIKRDIIQRKGGGVIAFQGMQDHTADSIKSLEGFRIAWVDEAQCLSARSLELLDPTIRVEGSEIWFSWNRNDPSDAVEKFLDGDNSGSSIVVKVNYYDNPFNSKVVYVAAERWRRRNPDTFGHVWLGEFNTKADDQVLNGCWVVDQFEPRDDWDGPYYGADWGFSDDPSTLVKCWVGDNTLYIEQEAYQHHVEIDHTPEFFDCIEGSRDHVIRADNARPEIISYMQRNGFPRIQACRKGKGSVEDGISKLRGFDNIVIHPRCLHAAEEARLWKYARNRAGDILPKLIDANNHIWDAVRYAIEDLIFQGDAVFINGKRIA